MARLREKEEVGWNRRARLANRILEESVKDVEETESPTLFAQSEYERPRSDADARVYGTNCLVLFGL